MSIQIEVRENLFKNRFWKKKKTQKAKNMLIKRMVSTSNLQLKPKTTK